MAAGFRAGSSVSDSTADTITVTKPTGTSNGDILIAGYCNDSGAGKQVNSIPSGWTAIDQVTEAAGNGNMGWFYKVASSEGASWDFGFPASAGHKLFVCGAWQGYTILGTVLHDHVEMGNGTNAVFSTLTNSGGGTLLVSIWARTDTVFSGHLGADTVTWGGSETERISVDNQAGDADQRVVLADKTVSGNLTGWTSSTNNASYGMMGRTVIAKVPSTVRAGGSGVIQQPVGPQRGRRGHPRLRGAGRQDAGVVGRPPSRFRP